MAIFILHIEISFVARSTSWVQTYRAARYSSVRIAVMNMLTWWTRQAPCHMYCISRFKQETTILNAQNYLFSMNIFTTLTILQTLLHSTSFQHTLTITTSICQRIAKPSGVPRPTLRRTPNHTTATWTAQPYVSPRESAAAYGLSCSCAAGVSG